MLSKHNPFQRDQLEMLLYQLVPQDHLVRKIEAALEFNAIYKTSYKRWVFRKHDYVYDEYFDCYLCPAGRS